MIEDSQVMVTMFRSFGMSEVGITGASSTRANPISDTVSGQRIIIPTDVASPSIGTHESIILVEAQPTVASSTIWNEALIGTDVTFDPSFASRRLTREVEWCPDSVVCLFYEGK